MLNSIKTNTTLLPGDTLEYIEEIGCISVMRGLEPLYWRDYGPSSMDDKMIVGDLDDAKFTQIAEIMANASGLRCSLIEDTGEGKKRITFSTFRM